MEVGQQVYCLVVGSDNKYHPLGCTIKGIIKRPDPVKQPDLFNNIERVDYQVKLDTGAYSLLPDKYLYPDKEWAQIAADNYNRQLP